MTEGHLVPAERLEALARENDRLTESLASMTRSRTSDHEIMRALGEKIRGLESKLTIASDNLALQGNINSQMALEIVDRRLAILGFKEKIEHQVLETDDLRKRIRALEAPDLEPLPKCKLCGQVAGFHDPDCLGATL